MFALDPLRAYLLPNTLSHAVTHSAFYRDHLQDAWRRVESPTDLTKLPLLTKALATREQERMRCGEGERGLGTVSSRTLNTAEFFFVEHIQAETDAIADYMRTTADARRAHGLPDATSGLILSLVSPNHGTSRVYSPRGLSIVWAPYTNVCDLVEEALLRSFSGERVKHLVASVGIAKELTVYFLDRKVDFSRFALSTITTHAALLTNRWRNIFQETWNATVNEFYGLSEFDTAAFECNACGYCHFGAPPLIAEAIDPFTHEPVIEGIGELVLTGLYPYVQRQPMIRYATGDLVELSHHCSLRNELGLRFCGRVAQSLLTKTERGVEAVVLPTALEHIVDALPEVARHGSLFEAGRNLGHGRTGQAKFRAGFREDKQTVLVEVGVAFDPRLFPVRTAAIRERIREELFTQHPKLKDYPTEIRLSWDDTSEGGWFVKADR